MLSQSTMIVHHYHSTVGELWHQIYFQCLLAAQCLHSGRVRWLLNYTIIPLSKLWPCRFNRWNISLILPQLSACSLLRPHMQKAYRTLSCWSTIAARTSGSGYIQYGLHCLCLPTNRCYFKKQKSLRARFCGFCKKNTHRFCLGAQRLQLWKMDFHMLWLVWRYFLCCIQWL